ncbi:MAG: hypothetical protein WD119_02835 [Pirellulaceae bacterium]
MTASPLTPPLREALRQVAGYLNFSSGQSDPTTLGNLNTLHAAAAAGQPLAGPPPWLVVQQWLKETIDEQGGDSGVFGDVSQARRCVRLVWSELLPAYLDFHRDLLFHQVPELLFNGFFIGRCCEAVLAELVAGTADQDVIPIAITRLNDFIGYRPVAQLENRHCEPYPHEWVGALPVYIKGAGVADGPYRRLIHQTLDILRETDPEILRAAHFEIDRLTEMAIDPREYDFEHPVNRRPNYQFGQWDPHSIDDQGYYHRFILQQVTLDALLSRFDDEQSLPREQLYFEAAAVLAGTLLMAAGISGWGPSAYGSDVTLASLMAPIAAYRDAYYENLLRRMSGEHADRLLKEAELRRQAFGAARQHLNGAIARQRAGQQQHAHLARLYAKMGYAEAAKRQADAVNVASARMMCRIDCALMKGIRAIRSRDLQTAASVPRRVVDLLHRGIECGAFVDPWSILGFAGNFNRFHGPDSGIHDQRVDDLIHLTDQLFGYLAKVWSEAAAVDDTELYRQLDSEYRQLAEWWRQFAAHTVEELQAIDPLESYESAKLVAQALRLWHTGGAATGDVKFWAPHAELFESPRAYALVIDALLQRSDFVASMALLIHWLSRADEVGMRRGNSSWSALAEKWLVRLRKHCVDDEHRSLTPEATDETHAGDSPAEADAASGGVLASDRCKRPWSLVRRFFDLLEANAESYWSPPQFRIGTRNLKRRDWDRELEDPESDLLAGDPDPDNEAGLFDAAYEGVTYNDTTDDGFDGAVFDPGADDGSQNEIEAESRRLGDHLDFHVGLVRLWVMAADLGSVASREALEWDDASLLDDRAQGLAEWASRAAENRVALLDLLASVRAYRVQPGGADSDSMRQYDRRRVVRDALLERIIGTSVEVSDARRLLTGVLLAETSVTSEHHAAVTRETDSDAAASADSLAGAMGEDDRRAVKIFAALVGGDSEAVRREFPALLQAVLSKNLLYIPLSRGGDPVQIFVARLRQRVLMHLLRWLPRRGLFVEACRLIEAARVMEQQNPVGPGAVTEFDRLFRIGFRSMVQTITHAAHRWSGVNDAKLGECLIPVLESLTETLLASWLTHSRSLRLSALESVSEASRWNELVEFVKRYGDPIFTQTFLQLGNVRAILHQGVDTWLQRLAEDPSMLEESALIEELGNRLEPQVAQKHLSVVFESLLDHHAEYLDYSSTTTQSDRGEMLYMFLDFLRLRVRYDRVAWNLKPVMWAHEILVRNQFNRTAALWQRSLSERIESEAELYMKKLGELQRKYSMRMPTVADRISERFIQPMIIDRIRALVEPSIDDAEQGRESPVFTLLEKEADVLTAHPTGAGLDLPVWLSALEEEIETVMARREGNEGSNESLLTIPEEPICKDDLEAQLQAARRQGRRLPYMK